MNNSVKSHFEFYLFNYLQISKQYFLFTVSASILIIVYNHEKTIRTFVFDMFDYGIVKGFLYKISAGMIHNLK